jgi:hypothetical protein
MPSKRVLFQRFKRLQQVRDRLDTLESMLLPLTSDESIREQIRITIRVLNDLIKEVWREIDQASETED